MKRRYGNRPKGKYKSELEYVAAEILTKENIDFEYESWQVVLQDSFKTKLECHEKIGKKFRQNKNVISVKYTPDFVGKDWIIETKGKKTEAFMIRWKLFKKYLEDNNLNYRLFMPSNKKEVLQSVEIIKSYEKNR